MINNDDNGKINDEINDHVLPFDQFFWESAISWSKFDSVLKAFLVKISLKCKIHQF